MVVEDDESPESRIPTLEDLLRICSLLNARGAKYIVVGGMAILHHGAVRATEDIDLLVETSLKNEKAVLDALGELEDGAAKELTPGDIAKYEVIRVADEVVVDIMKLACGVSYSDAMKGIAIATIKGVNIPFAGVQLMIRLKQGIRPKDKADLLFLQSKLLKTK